MVHLTGIFILRPVARIAIDSGRSCIDPTCWRYGATTNGLAQRRGSIGAAIKNLFFVFRRITAVHRSASQVDDQVGAFQLIGPVLFHMAPVPATISNIIAVYWQKQRMRISVIARIDRLSRQYDDMVVPA